MNQIRPIQDFRDDGKTNRLSVAVIGSGISGLSAAWLLSQSHGVTLFEAGSHLGGHSNTVVADTAQGLIPVDTGFIVYNSLNYPNLTAFFKHLDVPTRPTAMSFSVSLDGGRFEYSGSGLQGLLAQRSNALKPGFWMLVREILRFYREAPALLNDDAEGRESLGDYLARNQYSKAFMDDHLLPMAAAIWSAPTSEMLAFPATSFIRFFANHGLLQVKDRPMWGTVVGGSRNYVDRVLNRAAITVRPGIAVDRVLRDGDGVRITDAHGREHRFDHVVIATHADQALNMLAEPSAEERRLLGVFRYQSNRAVLHGDPALMPRRKRAWAAWNYARGNYARGHHTRGSHAPENNVSVTYWMNALQHLNPNVPLFVSLNPDREPARHTVHYETDYDHPLFDGAAMAAQKDLWRIQGSKRTWFCGAHFGYGFHEDGIQSSLAVAEALGGVRRPWQVAGESGRITLGPDGHMRAPSHLLEGAP